MLPEVPGRLSTIHRSQRALCDPRYVHFRGQVKDGLAVEHPELHNATQAAIAALLDVALVPTEGAAAWAHDLDYVQRAKALASHLEAAMTLANARAFSSSYVIARTSLEHMIIDRLLMLSTRYTQRAGKMTPDEFASLKARLESGDLPPEIQDVRQSSSGHVTVERTGHNVMNNGEIVEQLSVYHSVLDQHVPIIGPPDIQDRVGNNHFLDAEEATEAAKRHKAWYEHFLRWSALISNLRLNRLATDAELFQYELHYRFLSAFTHATDWGYGRIRRGEVLLLGPPHDKEAHILGELTLLYSAHVAATELETLVRYCDNRERVRLDKDDNVRAVIHRARAEAAHLWFPPASPTAWDLNNEANHRSFKTWADRDDSYEPMRPQDVSPEEVAPVPDQIKRLGQLHVPSTELVTGNTYVPSWWPTS